MVSTSISGKDEARGCPQSSDRGRGAHPEQEYLSLAHLMDPKTEVLARTRICFLWNNQYYELDRYGGRHEGSTMLLAESPHLDTAFRHRWEEGDR